MKRRFPVYTMFTAGAMMVGFTAVLSGLTVALDTTGAHAGAVSTVTVTPPVQNTDSNLDISTGTIENVFSSIYSNPAYDNLEEFTALSNQIPPDLAEQILQDSTADGGYLPESPQFVAELTAIMNSANNPTAGEFVSQTTPSELAYSLPTVTQVGYTSMKENGQTFYVPTYSVDAAPCPTLVVNPAGLAGNITNIATIAADSIGDRVAAVSGTSSQIGNDQFLEVGDVDTSTTTTVGNLTLTTVTDQEVDDIVNVNLYQVEGYRFVSPIVLDISGSGRLQASNGMWLPHPGAMDMKKARVFDFYNNGFPMAMEWVGPKDGLLVEPKADGSVDATCLFGTQGGWMNGYQKLSLRDKNGDGRLTGDELKGLYVWVDANQDAKCQPNELKSVQELGITEIDLHQHHMQSVFVMNGVSHRMWDWFPSGIEVKHVSKATAQQEVAADKAAMSQ